MATLLELANLWRGATAGTDDLESKVIAAVLVAADNIRTEAPTTSNHANRLIWAKQAFTNPDVKKDQMWGELLAQNAASPVSSILGASDSAIQSAVNTAIDIFATGS